MCIVKVVCAIIAVEKKILICKRSAQMSNPLCWEFPGGKQLKNESQFDAIKRECLEELDIHVTPISIGTSVLHKYETIHIELDPIYCTVDSGTIKLNEHLSSQLCFPNELKNFNFSLADKKIIEVNKTSILKISE